MKINNYDIYVLYFIIILSVITFIIDIRTNNNTECLNRPDNFFIKKICICYSLFIHHLLQNFAVFGWLFNNKLILWFYVLIPFLMFIHWKTNNNQCVITQIVNGLCKFADSDYFNGIFNIFHFTDFSIWNNYLHYLYIIITCIIALFKINRKN
jgi:hypothetical protein